MIKLGLLGYPIKHSLSKVMHEAALKELNLQGSYDLLETHPEDLVTAVKDIKRNGYLGFNVTIPHKVPIAMFLDEADNTADIAGCANTVKIMPDKSLVGYNTDIHGFKCGLNSEYQENLKGKKAAILGLGGAARAVVIALCAIGLKEIDFYTRNLLNSTDTVDFLREKFPSVKFNLKQLNCIFDLSDVNILINATPVGLRGYAMDKMPISEVALSTMEPKSIVYDLIYNPRSTLLLKAAQKNQLITIDGIDMLVNQAVKSFEIWTEKAISPIVMKMALLDSLTK